MNPSTFKQVAENFRKINELTGQFDDISEALGDLSDLPFKLKEMASLVQDLEKAVLEPSEDEDTGLIPVLDGDGNVIGSKVAGLHNILINVDKNLSPCEYGQGLTLELKKRSIVGLGEESSFAGDYCFVLTMVQDAAIKNDSIDETSSVVPATDYRPIQLAFADANTIYYQRCGDEYVAGTGYTAWGQWSQNGGGHQQIVQSDEAPTDQTVGDYWAMPITDAEG